MVTEKMSWEARDSPPTLNHRHSGPCPQAATLTGEQGAFPAMFSGGQTAPPSQEGAWLQGSPGGADKPRELPLAILVSAASELISGAPLRLMPTALCPPPLARDGAQGARPHPRPCHQHRKQAFCPLGPQKHTSIRLYKPLPRSCLTSPGLHPELALGSVPPTGHPAALPTSGPWLPRGSLGP